MNKKDFMIRLKDEIATALIAGEKTHEEIGQEFGVTAKTVRGIAKAHNIVRKRGLGSPAYKFKQSLKVN
jgi:predicted transcriptional regulator